MLVFITPKLDTTRIPYSYRSRATIPSSQIKNSRVTDDIKSLKSGDIAVLGKKHSKEDAEYCISNEINYIVDVADDKFAMFKHWYFTIPNANAVTTTCHSLRELIQQETGAKSYVIPDPTERKRGTPKFEVKDNMRAFYYGSDGNYAKIDWPKVKETMNAVHNTSFEIMTNKAKYPPRDFKMLKRYGRYWLLPQEREHIIKKGHKQFDDLIAWDFNLQDKLVNKSDFVILPVTEDRESKCKGNNRPIDALQQGRMVLTNPGIPSYEDLKDFLYIGDLYEMYQGMINQPGQVVNKIMKAQEFIEQNYSPKAIAKKWEKIFVKHERPCVILLKKIIMVGSYSVRRRKVGFNILSKNNKKQESDEGGIRTHARRPVP